MSEKFTIYSNLFIRKSINKVEDNLTVHVFEMRHVPIIITEFYKENCVQEFDETFLCIQELINNRDEPKLFWIADMCSMKENYENVIGIYEKAYSLGFLTDSSSRIIPFPVGTQHLYGLFKEIALDRHPHTLIPFFYNIEQALRFVDRLID